MQMLSTSCFTCATLLAGHQGHRRLAGAQVGRACQHSCRTQVSELPRVRSRCRPQVPVVSALFVVLFTTSDPGVGWAASEAAGSVLCVRSFLGVFVLVSPCLLELLCVSLFVVSSLHVLLLLSLLDRMRKYGVAPSLQRRQMYSCFCALALDWVTGRSGTAAAGPLACHSSASACTLC